MAKATKRPEEYTVTLDITRSEAETLLQVLNNIGGMVNKSPRRYTEAIGSALYAAGVEAAKHMVSTDSGHGRIVFEDFTA